jgi:phosphomannomutase
MITEDVLLGVEESGGIAVKGHIPERDGIWMGLIIMEYMAKTGKTLEQLIAEVYKIVGSFWFERYDLHITESLKQKVLSMCAENQFTSFGSYQIRHIENVDGYKFFFDNDEWVMIRASGTEPLLRVYGESNNKENVIKMLDTVKTILLGLA